MNVNHINNIQTQSLLNCVSARYWHCTSNHLTCIGSYCNCDISFTVSASQQNIHMLNKLLHQLRVMVDCACWGRPLGSTLLWEQHLRTINRIRSIANHIQIREVIGSSTFTKSSNHQTEYLHLTEWRKQQLSQFWTECICHKMSMCVKMTYISQSLTLFIARTMLHWTYIMFNVICLPVSWKHYNEVVKIRLMC